MYMYTRKRGSSRPSARQKIAFEPNSAGQGGNPYLTIREEGTNRYIMIVPESIADVREIMSQAHLLDYAFDHDERWKKILEQDSTNEA